MEFGNAQSASGKGHLGRGQFSPTPESSRDRTGSAISCPCFSEPRLTTRDVLMFARRGGANTDDIGQSFPYLAITGVVGR